MSDQSGGGPLGETNAPVRGDRFEGFPHVPGVSTEPPVFVGREIYRRRRMMDTAKLLPAFGTVLVLMPILWASDHGTASGLVYMFVVWAALILMAGLISRRLSEPLKDPTDGEGASDPPAVGKAG